MEWFPEDIIIFSLKKQNEKDNMYVLLLGKKKKERQRNKKACLISLSLQVGIQKRAMLAAYRAW